jgi:hypothetical protein
MRDLNDKSLNYLDDDRGATFKEVREKLSEL